MKFAIAVNILSEEFGDELSNERRKMKRYVKKHPENKLIAEAFEVYVKVVGMPKKDEKKIDWSVHGGKSHAPRGKRKDRYFRKWYLFDTQTGEKHEFEIAQEVADFVGCGVTTVIIARKKKTMLKKRYKVIAVK
ncbi:hypothetical protein E4T91_05585 [Ligilactobacillus murinus]|uniref:hypothetical protein n=1 Tax=Ligilactobacillus murinus TaxID=1622 RepID=UPI001072B349|nr:hypothetical protein [Ligilactobacillus murinus]MBF0758218.1 hypothetical protein [Ligilactobacillus murinus]MBF0831945.1 hypothetical protein [Ligilactobacillus murinus]MCR1897267.1 hypothetical protein [Ligilactobacillus murinus]TFU64404.1 hypothetical protein E4T91_05585 [Ligilactobacillus murinus]